MTEDEVLATFGAGAVRRVLSAFGVVTGLIGAAAYGQIGPGVHANILSVLALLAIVLGTGVGKWLLSSFEIFVDLSIHRGRALYIEGDRLVFISPRWMSFRAEELASVEVASLATGQGVREMVRMAPRSGSPVLLPPGLTRESPAEIAGKVSSKLGVPLARRSPTEPDPIASGGASSPAKLSRMVRLLLISGLIGGLVLILLLVIQQQPR